MFLSCFLWKHVFLTVLVYLQSLHLCDLVFDLIPQGCQDSHLFVDFNLHVCDPLTKSLGQFKVVVVAA